MFAYDIQRIEKLRSAAVEPAICYDAFYLAFFERWGQNVAIETVWARYADAYACGLDAVEPVIDEGELIVGKSIGKLPDAAAERWETVRRQQADPLDVRFGQDSHMAIDYELLLNEGTEGVVSRIEQKLKGCAGDEAKTDFYKTCIACLKAAAAFSDRYADHAEKLARAAEDEKRRSELKRIAEACRRVPRYPAGSFYEAVQSVHFITFCLSMNPYRYFGMQQFQLGRPDRYLYPFYRADRDAGRLSDRDARTLMDCLAIQINNRVPHGLSSGYMLGGRDKDGRIVANELTRMGMQAVDDIRLVYPSVGLCWTEGMPGELLEQACAILSHGRSHPAVFNDDVISAGLKAYGVPEKDARDYIHSTCVEITPIAASNVWVASPYTNMLQLLLDLLDRDWPSFDSLIQALFGHLDESIRRNFETQNRYRALRAERTINPLLSCFVNDCLEQGVDIEQGGARFNWIMPSFVGMANLVDSLEVIRTLIFEKRLLTFESLREMLKSDFDGFEAMRLKMLNAVDKYGNDIDRVDSLFGMMVDHIVAQCRQYTPVFENARLIPSVFCWVMHEYFGRRTGASPDGRRAGFPLGDGSGPCQGREKNGPTASILSCTKWQHKELIGGVALNMKFSKSTFTADSCAKVAALIETYMRRGGFEIQINVVDRETLLKAQAEPENYRDLVVRIGGYSDYFVKLSPEMQAEVLLRTAHEA
ncbi:MAG: hypothetical protein K5784_09225 [Clostridiales bacterium]|nr:hypothetical protein [Clostridiales bacterium]